MKKAVAVGGGRKGGTGPTDLLVCFPARQHLALMPKPIRSPSRTTVDKAAAARRRPGASAAAGGGKARGSSPMFRGSKSKQRAEDEEEEPQSPKVTCVGQIKVSRPKKAKPASAAAKHGKDDGARSWLTVVEEIERLHGRRKKVGWLETLGIRRDALPFLGGALRGLRHKARCFGSIHGAAADSTTDSDEDNGDAEELGGGRPGAGGGSAAASVFSKWLMVLEGGQEPLDQDCAGDDEEERDRDDDDEEGLQPQSKVTDESADAPSAPPPNALLLMRCRSAPAKGLSMSRRGAGGLLPGDVEEEKGAADALPGDGESETEEDKQELVFMSTAPGFLKLSMDIAKETWVVGGGMDPLARSRSWKR
ncbi:uncharacterized protein LOC120677890 [Panicum virgatum]|uniref:Uncharacterized protein n=1 Tax=Panicum virgatum TaxID=38727 RepID=A0A8T0WCI6_PANVG|nr:uncharacterized protein LOC120677890 [Panicum virgatum]KAG2643084.1 hypothetical protein PVAP13_2KG330300 [Panicum virgatum]